MTGHFKLSNFLIVLQEGTKIAELSLVVLSAIIFNCRHGLVCAKVIDQVAAYFQRCILQNYHVLKAQGLTGALLYIQEVLDLKLYREAGQGDMFW